MNEERWKLVDQLLQEALELPAGQRDAFVREACTGDPAMADEIRSLLTSFGRAGDFLETPAMDLAARILASEAGQTPLSSWAGRVVSHYRILRLLGSGGMGSVFLAERCDGRFEREVAIKFIRLGAFDEAAALRFEREGAILARLAHPHIAELIDAGVSEDGEPFLVLEYVQGQPIDQFCDRRRLGVEGRIGLILDVLGAVEHAHRNLIVHRDLKPSNILVSEDGQAKLLDFGIAKLLGDEAGATTATLEGGTALTPRFAAPEQLLAGPVTTATDIYALGVLLYLLLTGRHPAGAESRSAAQLIRTIVEEEPPPASAASGGADAAAARSTTPERLRRLLRGDLDTTLAKALRKDPAQRYATATAFADDLRRLLRHEPISARPDSVSYRTGRFLRRHWLPVGAVAGTMTAILAVSFIAVHQARIAQRRFQEVRKLAHTFVFDLHDEVARLQGSTRAREMMVRTGEEYLDSLALDSGHDPELEREIAAAYMKIGDAEGLPTQPNLGRMQDALASYQKAGEIYQRLSLEDSAYLPDLARYDVRYAYLVRFSHDQLRARQITESAVRIFDGIRAHRALDPGQEEADTRAWCALGDMDEDMAHYRLAGTEFSTCRTLALDRLGRSRDTLGLQLLARADERVATASSEAGRLSDSLNALAEDESTLRELLASEPNSPLYHRMLALVYHYRTDTYYSDLSPSYGDPDHALEDARRYLAAADAMVQSDPSDTSARLSQAIGRYAVSFCLRESNPAEALRLARESVRMFDAMMVSEPGYLVASRRVRALIRLGEAQLKAGWLSQAQETAQLALGTERPLARRDGQDDEESSELVQALVLAAETGIAARDLPGAEGSLAEARERAQALARSGELTNVIPLANVERTSARLYAAWHRYREADACSLRLGRLWQEFPGDNEYLERQRALARQRIVSVSGR